jgi:hypothetical protein
MDPISYYFPCFTSFPQACTERKARIATLRRGGRMDRVLAAALERCLPDQRCGSPACPVCVRAWQRRVCTNMDQMFSGDTALHLVTLCHDRWLYVPCELADGGVERLKTTLRQQLKRYLPISAVAAGGIEVEYRSDLDCYMVHVHMLVGGASYAELRALRRVYSGRTVTGGTALRIDQVQQTPLDRARIFTYLFKWKTYMRDRQHGGRARRPPREVHNELLRFLAAHSFESLSFTYNLGGRGVLWA